jgi:hypothetical protein
MMRVQTLPREIIMSDDVVIEVTNEVTYQIATTTAIIAKAIDQQDYVLALIALWQMLKNAEGAWGESIMSIALDSERGREELETFLASECGTMQTIWNQAVDAFPR